MGLTPTFREGSAEHDVLLRLRRGSRFVLDSRRRSALVRLVDAGLATGGASPGLTPEGRRALSRIEQNGHYTPPLG